MSSKTAITRLPTHEVKNQPEFMEDFNAFETDLALKEAVNLYAPEWVSRKLTGLGEKAGSQEYAEHGFLANENPPKLKTFDRYGRRIDEVEFHPSYHELMRLALDNGWHAVAWEKQGEGGHVASQAGLYLLTQPEQGFTCPYGMTHAVIPALRQQPDVAEEWEPRILAHSYDPRCVPPTEKTGVTFGMAMTEKQGGSDVRANTTRAVALGAGGPGAEYVLTGHKWFCSAPMSDAFLTLAQTEAGLSCFLVPRWRPDGTRNNFFIQRLKDKLGNRSNASSEIEYADTWARMVGEEGRGVKTIIEMVSHSRMDAATAPPGMMRYALVQVLHHTRQRKVFGELLINQPLMRNVLAELALEVEASTAMVMRLAASADRKGTDRQEALFNRAAIPVVKYWTNKRAAAFFAEAMECLGGIGYVEENVLPRLYREAPVNSIWEGSGNVLCLDVLRAAQRDPESIEAFIAELELAKGLDQQLDAAIVALKNEFADTDQLELRARRITERMAICLQGSLLARHAPAAVSEAFIGTRVAEATGHTFGTLLPKYQIDELLERAWPV